MHFIYMNEYLIDRLLKCKLCSKPFIDPVITENGDCYCRLCAMKQNSSYNENLFQKPDQIILDMLDHLLVKCPNCQKENLRRIDLSEHLQYQCLKRIISCKASDLKCSWTGLYDEYNKHIQTCIFESLRPILKETIECKKELENYRKDNFEQKNQIYELKYQIEQYENRLDKLQKGFKAFLELNLQQKYRYDKFQNDLKQLQEENNIQKDNLQISNLLENFHQIQEQFNKYDIELKKYQDLEMNCNQQIKQLHNQNLQQTNQFLNIRQITDQHQVQINLLARKKCVIPTPSTCTNVTISELIENFEYNSEIDLKNKDLNNQDMESICKIAIQNKKCKILHLENNNITAKGISILSDTLYGNLTLVELYLTNNSISDIGVHLLAQVLSIDNTTLKYLEIHSNNITDEGAEYLSKMLKTNKTLISLGLNDNQITDYGIRLLTSAITCYNDVIQYLYLNSNQFITDTSENNFFEMLKFNRSLQLLALKHCDLSEKTKKKLKETVQSYKDFTLII